MQRVSLAALAPTEMELAVRAPSRGAPERCSEAKDLREDHAGSKSPDSDSIEGFVERLAQTEARPNSFNPFDSSLPENAARRRNLGLYLREMAEHRPRVLLLGEAPGYRGMRMTGTPFTNRAILRNGVEHFGLFGSDKGYLVPTELAPVASEPTATVMWQTLTELDFLPLLWSAYPFHPHQPGIPLSNRTPSAPEISAGLPVWTALAQLFGIRTVVAVGNAAHRSVLLCGQDAAKVRHPAHGGKVKFRQGLEVLLAQGIDDDRSGESVWPV